MLKNIVTLKSKLAVILIVRTDARSVRHFK